MNKVRVDFDVPSYLRMYQGLCQHSDRFSRVLPAFLAEEDNQPLEPVVINRLYRPGDRRVSAVVDQVAEARPVEGELLAPEAEVQNLLADPSSVVHATSDDISESEISFREGMEGQGVAGIYNGSGSAPYRFRKSNGRSFYLRVGKHLIWGTELGAEIIRCGAQQGDNIKVTFLGKNPVTVPVTVLRNGQKETDWKPTHRNSWRIEKID
ncbi:TPA: DNA primase [Pseudomonas aeruginosa]